MEVRRQEEAARSARAVSFARQGQWMNWENIEKRRISWKDLWQMEAGRISFLLRATYDVLPSPTNLHQWLGDDPACPLCNTPATLRHILTNCKISLSQGRYTWRHNQVLKSLAAALEKRRIAINSLPPRTSEARLMIPFVHEGEKPPKTSAAPTRKTQLEAARDWELRVDIGHQLTVPAHIAMSTLRPDMVLWANSLRVVYFIELTVPWEDNTEEAFERKRLRYSDLKAEAEGRGWKAMVRPVEVGCRGFIATSTLNLLKELGIHGQALRHTIREAADTAERCSQWLWMRRKDPGWAPRS